MTWFRVDDQFYTHPKAQAAGKDGRALWFAAGTQCAAVDSDGHVDGRMVRVYAALAEVKATVTAALVEAGLWHDHTTIDGCARCTASAKGRGGVKPGDFFFHDWSDYQLDKEGKEDPIHRQREKRRKALNRNRQLVAEIRERDRDLCRFCGVATAPPSDKRSLRARQLDHLDPWDMENALAKVVVSCRGCNVDKGERTVAEWVAAGGRPLLPAGTTVTMLEQQTLDAMEAALAAADGPAAPDTAVSPSSAGDGAEAPDAARFDLAGGQIDPDSIRPDPGLARETGPGQVGAGSDGSDLDRAERAGAGPGGDGPGGDGPPSGLGGDGSPAPPPPQPPPDGAPP